MHNDLRQRRKLFVLSYQDYIAADRALLAALKSASELVPDVVGHGYWHLGNRGSRIRILYERRDRALHRLMVARLKLRVGKLRLGTGPERRVRRIAFAKAAI